MRKGHEYRGPISPSPFLYCTLTSKQYPAPLPILLFLLWSRISRPSLLLLKEHTAQAIKPGHFPSLLHLHLALGPDINTCLLLWCHRPGPLAMLTLPVTLLQNNPTAKSYPFPPLLHIPSGSVLLFPKFWAGSADSYTAHFSEGLLRTTQQNS